MNNHLHWTVKKRLKPFEDLFYELRRRAFALVGRMTEAERKRLEEDFRKLTGTNCSWALPRMKEHVEDAIGFYRERDELIAHLHKLETDIENEEDHQIRSDMQRAHDATLKQLESFDESMMP